ncbi:RNA polymerase sigma factor [Streptomyces sp. NPDC020792]|uniref:RNA polymerase sigma factor n=1 Tax=Streptomyces sp. NPDC020792 TaxID=3365089 RepID=UPI00379E8E2B
MPAAFKRKSELTKAEAKEAILQYFVDHTSKWYGCLRSRLPERYVEDCFGKVQLDLTEQLEKIDARTIKVPAAYIWTMCCNVATDQLRKAGSEAKALVRLAALPQPSVVEHDYLADETRAPLLGFLTEVLTERQAAAYLLRHDDGFSGQEVAAALEIKYALARKELSIAQKAIDAALDDPEVNQRLRRLRGD